MHVDQRAGRVDGDTHVTSTGEPAAQVNHGHVDRRAGRSGEPRHVDRRAGRSGMIRRRRPQRLRIRIRPSRPSRPIRWPQSTGERRPQHCAVVIRQRVTSTDEPAAHGERTVTSTGEPADHGEPRSRRPASRPLSMISTAPTTAIAHSDTTIAPVTSTTSRPLRHDSTAPTTAIADSDTTIAPVTSTSEPAAQVNQVTSTGEPAAQMIRRRRPQRLRIRIRPSRRRRPASRPLR